MDRTETIWRWADITGLYMRHKDLNAEQILRLYNKQCVRSADCDRWRIVDRRVGTLDASCFGR
jgi:hypothetical protein